MLKKVVITGIDSTVSMASLLAFQKEHSNVEFGVVWTGFENSACQYIEALCNLNLNVRLHLFGIGAIECCKSGRWTPCIEYQKVKGIQVDYQEGYDIAKRGKFILPGGYNGNLTITTDGLSMSVLNRVAGNPNVQFLLDPYKLKYIDFDYYMLFEEIPGGMFGLVVSGNGYGAINDCIRRCTKRDYWIELSGINSDGCFDIDMCKRILKELGM